MKSVQWSVMSSLVLLFVATSTGWAQTTASPPTDCESGSIGNCVGDLLDERNRVVDIHALRVTFGTHLSAAGVPLRTAQAAMRHSKPELTANVYTDPKLLDIAGAIDALPSLRPASEPTQASSQVG